MLRNNTFTSITTFEDNQKAFCRDVQRDPYSYVMTNYERQMAKQLPLRMFFNGISCGAAALYYLSRHNELNRVMKLRFSADMIVNVGARVALAFILSDIATRKLFVNY